METATANQGISPQILKRGILTPGSEAKPGAPIEAPDVPSSLSPAYPGREVSMTKPAVILLVEDNRMDVELTLDAFRQARFGNTLQVVRSGEEALDYLFGRDRYADRRAHPLPDLVLLDLKLPGLHGHEVLHRIKTTEGLKRIPVVILTSSKEERDLEMSYDRGANSYLVKPISFDGFMGVVSKIGEYWLTLNVGPPQPVFLAVPGDTGN